MGSEATKISENIGLRHHLQRLTLLSVRIKSAGPHSAASLLIDAILGPRPEPLTPGAGTRSLIQIETGSTFINPDRNRKEHQ